jgi:hypothetical protein
MGAPLRAHVAAIRLSGRIDDGRLRAAIAEATSLLDVLQCRFDPTGAMPTMRLGAEPPAVTTHLVDGPDDDCVRLLRDDRDRLVDPSAEALVRFHLMRRGPTEMVVGLVADPLLLDQRSVYLVLGAVLQAYLGRLRPGTYSSATMVSTGTAASRQAWWSNRLRRWQHGEATGDVRSPAGQTVTRQFDLDPERWQKLATTSDPAGNTAWLAVIAMVTWWRHRTADLERPVVFTGALDLRDYLGLGAVVGPFTDRLVFEVELDGVLDLTFGDLVRRTHAGLLDAVVHYLPYDDLVSIGSAQGRPPPPRRGVAADVAVHYCRLPPTSQHTRGEETLAQAGLSIELFCESALLAGGVLAAPLELQVAESGTGMAIVANFDPAVVAQARVDGLMDTVNAMLDQVAPNAATPLRRLPVIDRTEEPCQ